MLPSAAAYSPKTDPGKVWLDYLRAFGGDSDAVNAVLAAVAGDYPHQVPVAQPTQHPRPGGQPLPSPTASNGP